VRYDGCGATGKIEEGFGLRFAGISGRGVKRRGKGWDKSSLIEMLEILEAVVGLEDLGDGLESGRCQSCCRVGRVAIERAQTVENECRFHFR